MKNLPDICTTIDQNIIKMTRGQKLSFITTAVFICLAVFIGTLPAQIETCITASDGAESDYFGKDVAISADYLAVGSPNDDNKKDIDAGSVYIYQKTAAGWGNEIKLIASDGTEGALFGYSVSLTDNYLVVGAPQDDAGAEKSGAVYVLGHRVTVLADSHYEAGFYNVVWDGKDIYGNFVPSGIYLLTLKAEGFAAQKKMTLIR
jgi:hypothetical protein